MSSLKNIGSYGICSRCGNFEKIAGLTFDGKESLCNFCLNDRIIEANSDETYREAEPLREKTIQELKDLGWLKRDVRF